MSKETGINWADRTWNPVIGCTQISDGVNPSACDHCYAEARDRRRLQGDISHWRAAACHKR